MKEIKAYQRGDRWAVSYRVSGYSQVFYESFLTEAEAKARAAELTLKKLQGTLRPPIIRQKKKMPTLKELLAEYVESYGKSRWGDSQYSVVTRQIRDYIDPAPISGLLIKDISPVEIDRFFNDLLFTPVVMRKGHTDTGKTVGISIVEKIRATIRSAFNQAIKWGYITSNPVVGSTLPKVERQSRTVWKPDEAQYALSACGNELLRLCMLLSIGCSMRIGEILGLQWSSVHLTPIASLDNPPTLHVKQELKRCDVHSLEQTASRGDIYFRFPARKQAHTCTTVLVLKAPKTATSVRTLYIPATVVEVLKAHQERQSEEKRKAGKMYDDYDLVIAQPDGRPVEERYISKELEKLVEETRLPKVVFHSLRHLSTSLKLQYSGGDIKAVQGDTGHAQADMVTSVYAHTFDDNRRSLANLMESNFFEKNLVKKTEVGSATLPEVLEFEKLLVEKPDAAKSLIALLKIV